MRKSARVFYIASGSAFVLISLYGFLLLRARPGIPGSLRGREILRIDGVGINATKALDFVLSGKRIGDEAEFITRSAGRTETTRARLVAFYSQASFPFIFLVIGVFGFLIGASVLLLKPEDARARIFFWAAFCFSASLIINGDYYCVRDKGATMIPGVLFNFAYPMVAALLLAFSLTFSRRPARRSALIPYLPAGILGALLNLTFLGSVLRSSPELFSLQQKIFIIFRWSFLAYAVSASVALVVSLTRAEGKGERARIQWLLYGLFVGLAPFALFYQLPLALGGRPLLSEELTSAFFLAIPAAFAISIVRHKLMDIEFVINRSVVYSLLTILTASIYLLSIEFLQGALVQAGPAAGRLAAVAAAVLSAAAFHPLRKRVQDIVDRAFFRQRYDYQKAVLAFAESAQMIADPESLAELFMARGIATVPLDQAGVAVFRKTGDSKKLILSRGFDTGASTAGFEVEPGWILARKNALAAREQAGRVREGLPASSPFEVAVPLPFSSTSLEGFVVLGRKRSKERYREDDLDLFMTLAADLALNLERMELRDQVVFERASREKADELNRLKSEFISSVSHELRNPISSIQGLSEILESGAIADERKREGLLRLLASECARLSRFLHNVLDFGKIEQGARTYRLRKTSLRAIVEEVSRLSGCGAGREGSVIRTVLPEGPVFLEIDADAVKQALMNLVDNAIKYSPGQKEVDIEIVDGGGSIEVRVHDRGIGITAEEYGRVFDPFYRSPRAAAEHAGGVGLGLGIVRHIMEGHGGTVRLESAPGQGSVFSLVFPKP
jgi:signal transduction histidine kinase